MREINQTSVKQYWANVKPSILGPYMMDGFGFPVSAGNFRFQGEFHIVKHLLRDIPQDSTVLDLGSGAGHWAEAFACHFSRVIAVERSHILYQSLEERCIDYPNIHTVHDDVLAFKPSEPYRVVFLGGLLMYLDESDITTLLQKLNEYLEPGGIILCRESTVHGNTLCSQDNAYPVVYRSVLDYQRIFKQCRLTLQQVKINEPYIIMQRGCELIKQWKRWVPESLQVLSVVGRLTYWGLRLGNPCIKRLPKHVFGVPFPKLENHFFVLTSNKAMYRE